MMHGQQNVKKKGAGRFQLGRGAGSEVVRIDR